MGAGPPGIAPGATSTRELYSRRCSAFAPRGTRYGALVGVRFVSFALLVGVGLTACSSTNAEPSAVTPELLTVPESSAQRANEQVVSTTGSATSPTSRTDATSISSESSVGSESDPAACAVPPRADTDGSPTSITVWHFLDGRVRTQLENHVATFEAAHPTANVDLVAVPGPNDTLAAWKSAAPGERPDMVLLGTDEAGSMVGDPNVLPLDGCVDEQAATFLPLVRANYTFGGQLQAAPYTVSVPVLYFDEAKAQRAGIDSASPPANLGELGVAVSQMLSSRATSRGLLFDTERFSGGAWWVEHWLAQQGISSLSNANGRNGPATSTAWSSAEAIAGLTELKAMTDSGLATWIDNADTGFADLLGLVDAESPSAFAIHTSGALGDVIGFLDGGSYPDVELAVAPMPGPGTGSPIGGSAWWLAGDTPTDRKQLAVELTDFLVSPESQAQLAASAGYVPARMESPAVQVLSDAYRMHPELRVAFDVVLQTPVEEAYLTPISPVRAELRQILVAAVRSVFVDGADPTAALAAADRAASALLRS
ncbi:MAG: extracellular solute-binding protein [Ilumatobacteraceae bacterium]